MNRSSIEGLFLASRWCRNYCQGELQRDCRIFYKSDILPTRKKFVGDQLLRDKMVMHDCKRRRTHYFNDWDCLLQSFWYDSTFIDHRVLIFVGSCEECNVFSKEKYGGVENWLNVPTENAWGGAWVSEEGYFKTIANLCYSFFLWVTSRTLVLRKMNLGNLKQSTTFTSWMIWRRIENMRHKWVLVLILEWTQEAWYNVPEKKV